MSRIAADAFTAAARSFVRDGDAYKALIALGIATRETIWLAVSLYREP